MKPLTDKEVIQYIRKYFIYNPDGTFTRKDHPNSSGSFDKDGYLIIKIKGKQYKAHRLVYAYFNGRFPPDEIDHINRVRSDNRIENLRACTRQQNIANTTKRPNPVTGVVGVHCDTTTKGLKKKYTFSYRKKTYRFYTLEEAVREKERLHGNS